MRINNHDLDIALAELRRVSGLDVTLESYNPGDGQLFHLHHNGHNLTPYVDRKTIYTAMNAASDIIRRMKCTES